MRLKNVNMLSGSITKNMFLFAIPVFLSDLINLLFNAVDLIVVGQFCGSHAIAAVGSTSRIVNLTCCLFLGFSAGFGVVLSHIIGEGNKQKISRAVNTAIPFAAVLGVVLTVLGLLISRPMLKLMNTPADIIDDANLYLKIYFGGVTLRLVMLFVFNVFRMSGDSGTPTVFLGIGGLLNVVFNIFFVKVLNMTVDGVAWGTVISEGTAAMLGIITLMRRNDELKFSFKKICFDKEIIVKTIKIGIPSGLQTGMFSVSTLILTSAVNTLGTNVITANSAAVNIDEILLSPIVSAYCSATSSFTGQNYGAGNYQRIKQIFKSSVIVVVSATLFMGILVNIFSKQLLSLYITDNPAAIGIAQKKLLISALLYFMSAADSVMTSAMRGLGDAKKPLYVSIVTTCILKVVWVYTIFRIPGFGTYVCLAVSYPTSWILTIFANIYMLKKDWKKLDIQHNKNINDKRTALRPLN